MVRIFPPAEHAPPGFRRQTERIGLHPPTARRVEPAERQIDHSFFFNRAALNDRPIQFVDPTLFEKLTEAFEGFAVAPEDQTSRGIAIEPMRQSRTARKTKAQRAEIVFETRTAFWTAMDGDARRLVEDKHHSVAIKQASDDVVGRQKEPVCR